MKCGEGSPNRKDDPDDQRGYPMGEPATVVAPPHGALVTRHGRHARRRTPTAGAALTLLYAAPLAGLAIGAAS